MPTPEHIIGIIGTAGAGKSYASTYIVEQYDAEKITFSDYLTHVLQKMALDRSRENMIKLSVILRKEFGEEILSHAVAADALRSPKRIVLIDGIRRVEDLAAFKSLPNFTFIAVDADPKLRFERMKGRHEKTDDAEMTWEAFQKTAQAPTEVTIPETMKYADYTIMNDGTLEEYQEALDDIMKRLGIEKK